MPRKVAPEVLLQRRLLREARLVKSELRRELIKRGLRPAREELDRGALGSFWHGIDALTADRQPSAYLLLMRMLEALSSLQSAGVEIPSSLNFDPQTKYLVQPPRPPSGRPSSQRGRLWRKLLAPAIIEARSQGTGRPKSRASARESALALTSRVHWYLKLRRCHPENRRVRDALKVVDLIESDAIARTKFWKRYIERADAEQCVLPVRDVLDRSMAVERARPIRDRVRERVTREFVLKGTHRPETIDPAVELAMYYCFEPSNGSTHRRYRKLRVPRE